MPRIRRWHPVSHDFIRDPEVQDLRRRFGHWMSDVWLEMLSVADRNEGRIQGNAERIALGYSWIALESNRKARSIILNALGFMVERGWIEDRKDHFLVRNYSEYHRTRKHIESHRGIKEVPSEPSYPNEPSYPKDYSPKGESSAKAELTPQDFLSAWNEICASGGLPKVDDLTNGRIRKIKARIKKYPTLAFWERVFNAIPASDFLMGRKPSKDHPEWRATIDWLIKNDENPAKVAEGAYG